MGVDVGCMLYVVGVVIRACRAFPRKPSQTPFFSSIYPLSKAHFEDEYISIVYSLNTSISN